MSAGVAVSVGVGSAAATGAASRFPKASIRATMIRARLGPTVVASSAAVNTPADPPLAREKLPAVELSPDWATDSPRQQLRPKFAFDPKGGFDSAGSFVISGNGVEGSHGWFQKDFPVVQGAVLVTALTYVLANFLVDIVYGVVDPRIRLGV